jgi:hypothetical protein
MSHVEMLSGRRKKDYEAQQAAESLVAQAERLADAPPTEPIPESAEAIPTDGDEDEEAIHASASDRPIPALTRRSIVAAVLASWMRYGLDRRAMTTSVR